MNTDTQITENPFAITSLETAEKMAEWIAKSHCFGLTTKEQCLTLMIISAAEKQTLAQSLKRYHVFDTGKLSQRADYTKKEFEKTGTIIWHIRSDEVCAGSFFNFKPIDDTARERAVKRFPLQYELDMMMLQPASERDRKRESELMVAISALSREGEITVVRSLADAEAKGITEGKNGTKTNWSAGSRAMLQWRCLTEGANVVGGGDADGLSSDVDLQDARVVEQRVAIEQKGPQDRERDAIKAIMAQHLEEAETAYPERKRELLGLAAELRCKLAEMEPEKYVDLPNPPYPDTEAKTVVLEKLPPDNDQLPGIESPEPKLNTWQTYQIQTITAMKGKALKELSAPEIKTLYASFMKKDLPKTAKAVQKDATMISMAYEAIGGAK